MMRAGVVWEFGNLKVMDVPEPSPGEYQALVEILCCATCNSTDLRVMEGTMPWAPPPPLILGHESVGRVVEVGPRVRNFAVGDVVLRPTAVYPGERLGEFGSGLGGVAQLGLVTDVQAMLEDGIPKERVNSYAFLHQKVPPDLDPVDASVLVNLREVLSWVRQLRIGEGKAVLVVGDGPVGLTFVALSKLVGATVAVSGHHDERLELARKLGADLALNSLAQDVKEKVRKEFGSLDFLVDAVGDRREVQRLSSLLKPEGLIALYGTPKPGSEKVELDEGKIARITTDEPGAHEEALDLVLRGKVKPSDFYCDILPLEELTEAFRRIKAREAVTKLVIRCS